MKLAKAGAGLAKAAGGQLIRQTGKAIARATKGTAQLADDGARMALEGPKCFVAGTQVLAAGEHGSTTATNIEDIEVGDWVWSRNEQTGEEGLKPVVQLFRNQADTLVHVTYTTSARNAETGARSASDGWTFDGSNAGATTHTLTGTEEHPFWSLTRNTWVSMGKLEVGEQLLLAGQTGSTATVTATRTEHLSQPATVYNFEVADWHTYHVGTPGTGLILNSTGTSGGLTLQGDGTAASNGSGGVIQNCTTAGISLTTTQSINLNQVNVLNGATDGLVGSGVTTLVLTRCNITGNGNAVQERGVEILNLFGTCSITNCNISNNAEDNVSIVNNSSPSLTLTCTTSTFSNTSATVGNDGFHIRTEGATGNANMSVDINNCTFANNRGDHFQCATDAVSNGIMLVRFENNTMTGAAGNLGACITINTAGSSQTTFHIRNNGTIANPWTGAFSSAITINNSSVGTQTALLQGNIMNNVIGNPAVTDSGSFSGDCINVANNGNGTTTVNIANNMLRQYSNLAGINLALRDGAAGTLNATVTGNTISNPGTFASNGITCSSAATATDAGTVRLDISGNTVNGSGANGGTDLRVRHRFQATVRMRSYTGGLADTTAVNNYLIAQNSTGGPTASSTVNTTIPFGGQFQNTSPPGSAVPLPPAP